MTPTSRIEANTARYFPKAWSEGFTCRIGQMAESGSVTPGQLERGLDLGCHAACLALSARNLGMVSSSSARSRLM